MQARCANARRKVSLRGLLLGTGDAIGATLKLSPMGAGRWVRAGEKAAAGDE